MAGEALQQKFSTKLKGDLFLSWESSELLPLELRKSRIYGYCTVWSTLLEVILPTSDWVKISALENILSDFFCNSFLSS